MQGVYTISNKITGKMYVGSALNCNTRWNRHRNDLRNGFHHNRFLQRAWNKYGENSFDFVCIEECNREDLLIREQFHMDLMQSYDRDNGYNLAKYAESNWRGRTVTEEERIRISKFFTGRHHTIESRKKISEARKKYNPGGFKKGNTIRRGSVMSEESKLKMSNSMKGRKHTSEHISKIVKSRKGYTTSDITKNKIANAWTSERRRALCLRNSLRSKT